ncbi:MAG: hypothetical protein HZC02_03690 [Candidatus Levybacteria bacterium]|nr:hypothetical protein [Candidatus Levybacteria bacterium]
MKIVSARQWIQKLSYSLFFVDVAYAADPASSCDSSAVMTQLGCLPKDPVLFVSSFYGIGLSMVGGVALLFIIIGGYTILTSRGNPSQINAGKSYIFYSIAGLILAIFGYLFIEIFLVDLLHIPGLGH